MSSWCVAKQPASVATTVAGTEYEIVPCLASSVSAMALIDQFYLEEHPSYVSNKAVATLNQAKVVMRAHGMRVSSEWP